MYGKIFQEIFDSTIISHGGDTIYVFMSMIVLSNKDGILPMSVPALANRIVKDEETVRKAISILEMPDEHSNSKEHDGRRIVPLSQITDGIENRGWLVVNKPIYREKASKLEKAEKTAERVKRFKARYKVTQGNAEVTQGNAEVTHPMGHTDTDTDIKNTLSEFEKIWTIYPLQVRKKEASRHFSAAVKEDPKAPQKILEALENYKRHLEKNPWKKPQNGSTWFNNWRDWLEWKESDKKAEGHDIWS